MYLFHVHGRVLSWNASRSLSTVPFSCRSCSWMRNWPVLEQMAVLSALTSSPSPYRSTLIWEVWVDPRCLFSHCWVVSAGLQKLCKTNFSSTVILAATPPPHTHTQIEVLSRRLGCGGESRVERGWGAVSDQQQSYGTFLELFCAFKTNVKSPLRKKNEFFFVVE